jgi:hypothetical protein
MVGIFTTEKLAKLHIQAFLYFPENQVFNIYHSTQEPYMIYPTCSTLLFLDFVEEKT